MGIHSSAVSLVTRILVNDPPRRKPTAHKNTIKNTQKTPSRPAARSTAFSVKPNRSIPKAQPDRITKACLAYEKKLISSFKPLQNAFGHYSAAFSPDMSNLLFRSNRSGYIHQLYIAPSNKPTARPTPIAPGKDPIFRALFASGGKYVIFTRDRGGNQNFQIYRATPDGKNVTALTNQPKQYHAYIRLSPDGKTVYYVRGTHRAKTADIVAQPVVGGNARVVARISGFSFLTDVSPDGKRLLLTQLTSLSTSRTKLIDIATGKARVLAPPKGVRAHAHSAVFSSDGKSVYVVTNQGQKVTGVHRISVRTGKILATYFHRKAEVYGLTAPQKRGPIGVTMDMGTHRAVKLLHPGTLKPTVRVRLPLGSVSRYGTMSSNGRYLVIAHSSLSTPTESYAIDTRTGMVKRLRKDRQPQLAKLPKIKASVVHIPSFDGLKIPTIVYLPHKLRRTAKLPTIVTLHGGPANSSTIGWSPFFAFLVSRGFAVVAPNVRGSSGFGKAFEKADNGAKRMDAVRDLRAVAKWIRKQRWADRNRLAVHGVSYGGYMTFMALGHQPTLWSAGVSVAGISNLSTFVKRTSGPNRSFVIAEFGDPSRHSTQLKRFSPVTVANQFRAPLLLWQGENDPIVPRIESDQLVRALRKHKLPVEYMLVPKEGHGPTRRTNALSLVGRTVRFLEQKMGMTSTLTRRCRSRGH